jgi:hypothetical protein
MNTFVEIDDGPDDAAPRRTRSKSCPGFLEHRFAPCVKAKDEGRYRPFSSALSHIEANDTECATLFTESPDKVMMKVLSDCSLASQVSTCDDGNLSSERDRLSRSSSEAGAISINSGNGKQGSGQHLEMFADETKHVGSKNHPSFCKPCLLFWSRSGCPNGGSCTFCHMKHNRKKMRPCKATRQRQRQFLDGYSARLAELEHDKQTLPSSWTNLSDKASPFVPHTLDAGKAIGEQPMC